MIAVIVEGRPARLASGERIHECLGAGARIFPIPVSTRHNPNEYRPSPPRRRGPRAGARIGSWPSPTPINNSVAPMGRGPATEGHAREALGSSVFWAASGSARPGGTPPGARCVQGRQPGGADGRAWTFGEQRCARFYSCAKLVKAERCRCKPAGKCERPEPNSRV
jgi:hypothetical protein